MDAAAGIIAQPEAVAVNPIAAVEAPKPVATAGAKVFTPRAVQRKSGVVAHSSRLTGILWLLAPGGSLADF